NTDGWFMGYTPQLLAGAWVGCENNFLRFSTTAVGQGANTGLPIWAYFFQKVYADKTLKVDSKASFNIPATLNNDIYQNYNSNMQPGAEARDVGSGSASDYIDVSDYGEPAAPAPAPESNKPKETGKEKEKQKDNKQQQQQVPKATYPPAPRNN